MQYLVALSRRRITVVVALTLAALLQLALVLSLGSSISGGDADTYLALANDWQSLDRLLSPNAFEGNFWPAGYSGFLALFTPLGDNAVIAVRVVQVFLVLSMALLAGRLVRRVSESARVATVILVAFSPTLIWATWAIGYELVLGWLLLCSLVLITPKESGPSRWWPLGSGLLLGLALIVQFRAISVLPVLGFLAWRQGRRSALAWLIGLALPTLVWSLRGLRAHGVFAPWSTNSGYNLWNGNGPHATGHNVFPLPPIPAGEETQASAALHWILGHPSDFLDLVARKAVYLFYPTEIAKVSDRLPGEFALTAFQWICSLIMVLLLMAYFGAVLWRSSPSLDKLLPVFIFSLLYLAPNVLFIVEARFRIPVEPELIAIATATAMSLVQHSAGRAGTQRRPLDLR